MLRFVKAAEVANAEGMDLTTPQDTSLSGAELGTMTMLVLNRFLSQVNWEDVAAIYLSGLVDEEDMGLIQRACRSLVAGGIEFNG